MTYHTNKNRWAELNNNFCQLKSACRGQEFIINENKDIEKWAMELIRNNMD